MMVVADRGLNRETRWYHKLNFCVHGNLIAGFRPELPRFTGQSNAIEANLS